MCLCLCEIIYTMWGLTDCIRGCWIPLELELQAVESSHVVLETEPRFAAGVVGALNRWAITPGPSHMLLASSLSMLALTSLFFFFLLAIYQSYFCSFGSRSFCWSWNHLRSWFVFIQIDWVPLSLGDSQEWSHIKCLQNREHCQGGSRAELCSARWSWVYFSNTFYASALVAVGGRQGIWCCSILL